ncbi:conserved hypothetical protein [Uncinocarpus reesii 1704]|uniref:Exonuclease domain-containing protein n=1 Tax=Uncinocarpus reesii (strain UAMH 1704) TaxID=336963 RepID=C4JPT7_UNCRE|nr:uncharacterized protein UREG_04580 [Uncinocarpus reesii 1704]EEP79734.1 conserved hypothetical protein [Uncinocarpus reesii 1704]
MFNPAGLFKEIPCPEGIGCKLLNCMFAHSDKDTLSITKTESKDAPVTTGANIANLNEEPLLKRRRIDADCNESQSRDKAERHKHNKSNNTPRSSGPVTEHQVSSNGNQGLKSASKAVSPPLIHRSISPEFKQETKRRPPGEGATDSTVASISTLRRQVKKETLNPRHLSKPPVSHSIRSAILTKLHEEMVRLNAQLVALNEQAKRALILSEDELIVRALDEEEKAAKETPSVYSNVIKLRITRLKKMKLSEWKEDVLNYLRPKCTQSQPVKDPEQPIVTGLDVQGEIAMLSKFFASAEAQVKAGYITEAPSKEDIENATTGSLMAQGWEQCDRCNGRFQVFPGRREDGLLASGGPCTYHHARLIRPPRKKTDHIVGQTEAYFPCCNETVGTSTGCTKAESHVYKVTEVKRLAAILQFEKTPRQPEKGALPPVCFDCEMGYTTLGLELIRLTAITWPERKKLVDVLVRPMGEILDLNSRYSGVRPEHFANAIPYKPDQVLASSNSTSPPDPTVLPIVESPAAARALLFEHLQPETPIIGHAIDNDLNACRMIHPTIVDTVLLYPHPGGLPFRFGLRALAKKQEGAAQGHDSMEDAKATGDLVRVKVRETWTRLKPLGWMIKGGKLIEPQPTKTNIKPFSTGLGVLGAGAGTKRTIGDDDDKS